MIVPGKYGGAPAREKAQRKREREREITKADDVKVSGWLVLTETSCVTAPLRAPDLVDIEVSG